ncbi:MAG: Uma2 family endonuclease [Gemmatimonadaceae bacterium]
MNSIPSAPWTRAELKRLPDDGNRYEVLDGRLLVTPLPGAPHQRTALALSTALFAYCRNHSVGVVVAPGPVPHDDSELQPDIAVYLDSTIPFDANWERFPRADLVVEILSPSTRRRDLGIKRAAYRRWGIPEYWIVDTGRRTITVVRPGREDELVTDTLRWRPRPDVPVLEIALATIFS